MRTRWPVLLLCAALCAIMLHKLDVQMARLDGDLSVYYHSASELTSGISPYYPGTHYIYPPLFAWLMAPLAQLSPTGYAVVWGLLLGACWLASVLLVRRLTGVSGWKTDLVPSAILFRCIWNGWGHGQLSLLMSAMVLAFLVLERERRMVGATFWLAFAGAVKLFPFYLGVVLLSAENLVWVPVLGAWTLALTALPALTVGGASLWSMIQHGFFGPAMARINSEHGLTVNHAPVPHLFQLSGIESPLALKITMAACLLVVTALVLAAPRPRESRERDNLWLSFVLASALMVCPHVWMHYYTLLLLPVAAALIHLPLARGTLEGRVLAAGLCVATVCFNAGSRLFVSAHVSELTDTYGVPAAGLVALWLALGFVVLRGRACVARVAA